MKALLIVEDDSIADIIRFYLKPLGFDVLRYRNPLKALDNLEEIGAGSHKVSARDSRATETPGSVPADRGPRSAAFSFC
jgi:hypothetical protein